MFEAETCFEQMIECNVTVRNSYVTTERHQKLQKRTEF
jgi:hypothetical protein